VSTRDPRVDVYIERAAEFARTILGEIREAVHASSPGDDAGRQARAS